MSKAVKDMLISDLEERIGETRDMLVIDSSRLDAISANRMRRAWREKQITALTVRNSLARRALAKLDITTLDGILEGPSTLVWGGEDIVALSKEIAKWVKELEPLEIKGGTVEGTTLDAAGVDQLSKSPSREELIAKIAGMILSPGANLVAALLGPGGTLCGQFKSMADKEEQEPPAAEPQPAEA
jgi:large subunit ribosomal protein L10